MKKNVPAPLLTALLLLILPAALLRAQNIVPNSGFETQTSCPVVSEIQKAPPWNSPSLGTPDLFNSTCPSQNGPGHTGIGSSGIFCYSVFPNNREYIQARLTQPMVDGQEYCVSFYVKRTNFRYSISTIGAYFSTDSIYLMQTSTFTFSPSIESPAATQITSTNTWTEISGTYTASGGEQFIIIGNFRDDAASTKSVANASSVDSVAYYNIDDISVTACSGNGINEPGVDKLVVVYPNPATDIVNIEIANDIEEIKSVNLFDILSNRVIAEPVFDSGNHKITFNTSHLCSGTYFAEINTGTQRLVKKLSILK
ncbi:MAG: oprF 4 [Bacteroidota bacterium]|nr:oprF 4 [Bacteroidota bacterium]